MAELNSGKSILEQCLRYILTVPKDETWVVCPPEHGLCMCRPNEKGTSFVDFVCARVEDLYLCPENMRVGNKFKCLY